MRCPVVLAILGQQFWIILWWCSSLALLVSGFTFSYLWTQLYGGSYEQYVTAELLGKDCWLCDAFYLTNFKRKKPVSFSFKLRKLVSVWDHCLSWDLNLHLPKKRRKWSTKKFSFSLRWHSWKCLGLKFWKKCCFSWRISLDVPVNNFTAKVWPGNMTIYWFSIRKGLLSWQKVYIYLFLIYSSFRYHSRSIGALSSLCVNFLTLGQNWDLGVQNYCCLQHCSYLKILFPFYPICQSVPYCFSQKLCNKCTKNQGKNIKLQKITIGLQYETSKGKKSH